MKIHVMSILALIVVIACISCSGSMDNPVTGDGTAVLQQGSVRHGDASLLWGYYAIECDPDTGDIYEVPLRTTEFTCNVSRFIDGPPPKLLLSIEDIIDAGDYIDLHLDVGIIHPFVGLDRYIGFDVMGVFMGNGSGTYPGDPGIIVPTEDDQQLLNPDGYTRWFNSNEFAMVDVPLFAYQETKLGTTGYAPGATLNPYKYFADGLEEADDIYTYLQGAYGDRGSFRPGSVNNREYEIRFPGTTGIKFQYAVVARWEPNVNHPDPPDSLDDFPVTANATEAVAISVVNNESTLYYESDGDFGGNLIIDTGLFDWSFVPGIVTNEMTIKLYSDAWAGAYTEDFPITDEGDGYKEYHIDIPAETPAYSGYMPVWIECEYTFDDYSNPLDLPNGTFGPLASYYKAYVWVDDIGLSESWIHVDIPNGSESWQVSTTQDIIWLSSPDITEVGITYSTDGGMTYPYEITPAAPNTGTLEWIVPDTPSETCRIRIADTSDSSVYDESDDAFEIYIPSTEGNFLYGFADWNLFLDCDMPGNIQLIMNMLNLPLEGPYADNGKVLWYYGHADDFGIDAYNFINLVEGAGYVYEANGDPVLDVTGAKMLVLSHMFPDAGDPLYTPGEIQDIRDFIAGGGLCLVVMDNAAVMDDYTVIDALLSDLGVDFTAKHEINTHDPYYDITYDPITDGVEVIYSNYVGGTWDITGPNTVSLVRETDTGEHSIVKCPLP